MEIKIVKAGIEDLPLLMEWRMEVLHDVFSIPPDQPMTQLREENRRYYEEALPAGRHIACFAYRDGEIAGCGGLCLQQEMPSPDNPNGRCGYLMNIYTRKAYRNGGIGKATVTWLIEQARQRRITKIYLEASRTGYSLYKELGFHDMKDYMKL